MKWRYSLRWKLPHRPCPGPLELVSVVVEAGQAAPEEVMSCWVAGAGYAVCVDFLDERQIKRWSDERSRRPPPESGAPHQQDCALVCRRADRAGA